MTTHSFDGRNIKWNTLALPPVGELKHLRFILSVNQSNYNVRVREGRRDV